MTKACALVLSVGLLMPLFAQGPAGGADKADRERVCHTMGNLDRLLHEDAKMARRMSLIEKQTQSYVHAVRQNPAQRSQMIITIPVVFHVLLTPQRRTLATRKSCRSSRF